MSNMEVYRDEKVDGVEVEVLPVPATYIVQRKKPSFWSRLFRFILVACATFSLLSFINHGSRAFSRGCHKSIIESDDGHHQHPLPPVEKWKPFKGTTHFEIDPADASGLTVNGEAFGKVEFSTSKLSDKVVIDFDIRTKKRDKHNDISIEEKGGHLTIEAPKKGKLRTYASAKIQIPSNIIGTFGLPQFELNLPIHMVDYSSLPESLEIGSLDIRLATGFVKPGPVHTNTTKIKIAHGAFKGSLTQARHDTSIDVANGNVTLDIPSISSGNEGKSDIKLGNGHLNGTLSVYNSTTINVARGSIYVNVAFQSASADNRAELSTTIASGSSRVYVDSIAAERLFKSSHTSMSGDQLITYPDNFQGTIDARGIAGEVKLEGKDLAVEKVFGGLQGKKGDSERNYISVKAVSGALDILVGDE